MIPKLCKQCKHLKITTDGIDASMYCDTGYKIGLVEYGMICGGYDTNDV